MAASSQVQSSDTFLSDVHVGTFNPLSSQGTCVTRFCFTYPQNEEDEDDAPIPQAKLDDDGDMVVVRRTKMVIVIEHAMSTTLEAVGHQVWRGALLMVDYLLSSRSSKLQDSIILELGAGTGLVGIAASSKAKLVFCTDTGNSLLKLCLRNIQENSRSAGDEGGNVLVRELDWREPFRESGTEFLWTKGDKSYLTDVSLILASDVVYDNELTDAFFNCLAHVCCSLAKLPPTIIISLEKRLNFSLDKLTVASPYYEHFMRCLEHSYSTPKGELKFQARQIPTDFPQYSLYDRVKEMELWELTVCY